MIKQEKNKKVNKENKDHEIIENTFENKIDVKNVVEEDIMSKSQ